MDFGLRLILMLLYIAWLPAMLLGRLLGRDPLQSKKPEAASYWIVRKPRCSPESYFSEESETEGRPAYREGAENGRLVGTRASMFAGTLRFFGRAFR